jgi:hypothetical protein
MAMILSDYSSALKEILLPYIRDNFPKEKILVDQMQKTSDNFINDEFIIPVRTSRHGGVANLADDGNNVVSSGGSKYSRGTVSVKIVTGAFDISRLAIDATKTSKGAVESALENQAKTLASDFGRQVNRQMYGDGIGVVSKVRTTGGSVSATVMAVEAPDANVDDGRVQDVYGTVNGDISPVKYLAVGQIIGVGTGGAADGTVTAVSGTSVTVDTGVQSAANDSIYIEDGSGEGAGTSEFTGVKAALSSSTGTSTYAGLARSVIGWTPSFGSASEALTLSRIEGNYLSAREYSISGDRYIILVNKSLYQKYGDILTAMRRTVNATDLLGGYTGLEFAAGAGKVGVFLDYDCPDGAVLVINLDTWTLCQVEPMNWISGGDGEPLLRLQNSISYQATMLWFANVLCMAPGANGQETQKTK